MAPTNDTRHLGPDDEWPDHPKSWFRDALAEAKAAGWVLIKFSGYSFGLAACKDPYGDEPHCEFPIFKTGKAGESAARELQTKIRNCTHAADGGTVGRAAQMVEKAERLTDAAESLLNRDESLDRSSKTLLRVEELLEQANFRADESAEILEQAMEIEAAAQALGEEAFAFETDAREKLAEAEVASDLPLAAVVDVAEGVADAAKQKVKLLTQRSPRRLLMARLSQIKDRIREIRAHLGGL